MIDPNSAQGITREDRIAKLQEAYPNRDSWDIALCLLEECDSAIRQRDESYETVREWEAYRGDGTPMKHEVKYIMTLVFSGSIEAGSLEEAINHAKQQVLTDEQQGCLMSNIPSDAELLSYDVLDADLCREDVEDDN